MKMIATNYDIQNSTLTISCPDEDTRVEIFRWLNDKNWCGDVDENPSHKSIIVVLIENLTATEKKAIEVEIVKRWQKEIPLNLI